jgi:hypothetical protein
MDDTDYALGRTNAEYDRLIEQADLPGRSPNGCCARPASSRACTCSTSAAVRVTSAFS